MLRGVEIFRWPENFAAWIVRKGRSDWEARPCTYRPVAPSVAVAVEQWWLRRMRPEFQEQLSGRQKSQHHLRRTAEITARRSPFERFLAKDEFKDFKKYNFGKYWNLMKILIIKNVCLSVCLFGTDFSKTTWPILMKICMRYIHSLRMMPDRKKFRFREKKFSDFFRIFFTSLTFGQFSKFDFFTKSSWKNRENEVAKKRAQRA